MDDKNPSEKMKGRVVPLDAFKTYPPA